MLKPKVSIVMSTFNSEKFIHNSIESVIFQSFKDFEFIIIDDCSNDNTIKIIELYQNKDSRIILIKNKVNLWLTKNLNKWINISRWEYIARIDDDDIWCNKDKLKKQLKFMESNKEYGLCWTWVIFVNENFKEIYRTKNVNTDNDIRKIIPLRNVFAHSSVIIRKIVLDKVWYYDESFRYTQDYELWLRIWTVSKMFNIQEYLLKYMVRDWSISWKNRYNQTLNAFKISLKYKKNYKSKRRYLVWLKLLLILKLSTFTKKIWIYEEISYFWRKFILKNSKHN